MIRRAVRSLRRSWWEARVNGIYKEMQTHGSTHQCLFDDGCPHWEGLCVLLAAAHDRLLELETP